MEDNQASYNRKPVPKTQKEISNGFVDPYDPWSHNDLVVLANSTSFFSKVFSCFLITLF